MVRPSQRFCKRGHDTSEAGRYKNGVCIECAHEKCHEWNIRNKVKRDAKDMVRFGGLAAKRLRVLTNRTSAAAAWAYRWNRPLCDGVKSAERLWKADRITIECADKWCVTLGTHLAIVYPEAYWSADEELVDV